MKRVKPENTIRCFWELLDDGKDKFWHGGCEGDKGSHSHRNGEPLILSCHPDAFEVGTRIEERINTCPHCGLQVFYKVDKNAWFCEKCTG
jgi:ribosomal protein S27AE